MQRYRMYLHGKKGLDYHDEGEFITWKDLKILIDGIEDYFETEVDIDFFYEKGLQRAIKQ